MSRNSVPGWSPSLEKSPVGIAVVDFEGNYTNVNPAFCVLHGSRKKDLLASNFTDQLPKAQRAAAMAAHQEFLREGGGLTQENTVTLSQKHSARVRYESTPLQPPYGPKSRAVYATDAAAPSQEIETLRAQIIELELQNEQLRNANTDLLDQYAKLLALQDCWAIGCCTLDGRGRILWANKAALTLMGVTPEEVGSAYLPRFLSPGAADAYYLLFQQFKKTGERQATNLRITKPNGTLTWINLALAPQAEGTPGDVAVTLIDVTDPLQAVERGSGTLALKDAIAVALPKVLAKTKFP